MADNRDLINRLLNIIRSFDDRAYIAFANKGLLRRARKEIDKGIDVKLQGIKTGAIEFAVGEHTISMDGNGPSKANCSCPAPGGCQHILIVCLRFEDLVDAEEQSENDTPTSTTDTSEEDEWLSISEKMLRKWSGAGDFRKGCRLFLNELISVAYPQVCFTSGIECRLVSNAGLDGIISNSPPRLRKAYSVAAVLAYLQQKGVGFQIDTAPEIRTYTLDRDLLNETQNLIEQMINVGLNHLSHAMLQQLQQLSVILRTDGLVRASLELESCGTEIDRILTRHARADLQRLFNKLVRLYALIESIRNQGESAEPEYIGMARSKYTAADALNLVGMGAYPWETESGYIGLTTLFWSPDRNHFFSWSDSRPKHATGGFRPSRILQDKSPWADGGLLEKLSRSSFKLSNPKTNMDHRLSAHKHCRAGGINDTLDWNQLPPVFENWIDLKKTMDAKQPIGLKRPSPLESLCFIRPHHWHNPNFNETQQCLEIFVEDNFKNALLVSLPFSQMNAAAIYFLESYNANKNKPALLAYFNRKPIENLYPVSLFEEKDKIAVSDILFKPLPKMKYKRYGFVYEKTRPFVPMPQHKDAEDARWEIDHDEIALFLSPVDDYLIKLAESGSRMINSQSGFDEVDLSGGGLIELASAVEKITTARDLLIARYKYLLHIDLI